MMTSIAPLVEFSRLLARARATPNDLARQFAPVGGGAYSACACCSSQAGTAQGEARWGAKGGVNGIGRRGGAHRACEEESPATDREAMGDDGLDLVLRV